jgi:HSP20 family protein
MSDSDKRKPVQRFLDLKSELEEAFSSFIDEPWGRSGRGEWHVAVDVEQTGDEYLVTVDAPGVKLSDVNVRVQPGRITITGKRERVRWIETATSIRKERVEGSFCRRFDLEHPVEPSGITSELDQGILTIRIPKKKISEEESG